MARRRTIRMTQDDLRASALATRYPFQKLAIMEMLAKRFEVQAIQYHPRSGNPLVYMRHIGDSKLGAAVYPNGAVSRQNGTIKGSWQRVEDAASATIPDPFVAHLVAKEA
jgi:hypothetical protein